MLLASLAIVASLGAAAAAVAPEADDARIAVNPNLSAGHCTLGGELVRTRPGMVAVTVAGSMTGSLAANDASPNPDFWCSGYVEPEPHYCIDVDRAGWFIFHITQAGGVDTVLVLRDEYGVNVGCDDDGGSGLMSRMEVWLEPGNYSLFVGTYSQGYSGTYTMTIQSYGE